MNKPLYVVEQTGKVWETTLALGPDGALVGAPGEVVEYHQPRGHVAYLPREGMFGLMLVSMDDADEPDAEFLLMWKGENSPYILRRQGEVDVERLAWLTCADYFFPVLKQAWDGWEDKDEASDEGRMLFLIYILQGHASGLRLERYSVFDDDSDGGVVWSGEKVILPDESAIMFSPDGLEMEEFHAVNMQLMALEAAEDTDAFNRIQIHEAGRA